MPRPPPLHQGPPLPGLPRLGAATAASGPCHAATGMRAMGPALAAQSEGEGGETDTIEREREDVGVL